MRAEDGSDGAAGSRAGLSPQLEQLRERIAAARGREHPTVETAILLQDLETAHEELRVADEEVRAQQEQIAALLANNRLVQWQHERVLAALPVAVITTDRRGQIRSGNATAATLTGLRVDFLASRPVFSLFSDEDRGALREDLRRLNRDGGSFRRLVTLTPKRSDAVPAEVFASAPLGDDRGEVTWLLLRPPDAVEDGPAAPHLPRALVDLTTLPSLGIGIGDMVHRAAELCQASLGDRVTLSLSAGPPLAPRALATTSRLAQELDGAQTAAGEGPAVICFEQGMVVVSSDIHIDARWPRLTTQAAGLGGGFVVAAPITSGDVVEGTFTVYGSPQGLPDGHLVQTAQIFAAAIAAVLHELDLRDELASLAEDMQSALASRATIDQAKGIIMAEKRCGPDEAFQHLVELSSTSHVKLREVAATMVARTSPGS
jgi:PAS domain S-box-containing protein